MPLRPNRRALHAAFGRVPVPEGAAIHIARMAPALFAILVGLLYVLGDERLPPYQHEGNVAIVRHARPLPDFLGRAPDTDRNRSRGICRDESGERRRLLPVQVAIQPLLRQ